MRINCHISANPRALKRQKLKLTSVIGFKREQLKPNHFDFDHSVLSRKGRTKYLVSFKKGKAIVARAERMDQNKTTE